MASRPRPSQSSPPDVVGALGEAFIARWLQRQGWTILHQRWHCRWGELDLVIGQSQPELPQLTAIAFVEVKTRRDRNWDEDGKLALTHQKQTKLWKTAQSYLLAHPHLAELPCRFDVALVACQKLSGSVDLASINGDTTAIVKGYQLTIQEYLPDAFRVE